MNRKMLRRSMYWTGNPARYHLFTQWWHYLEMESMGQVLGPASTHFNDYLGTVASDDAEAVLHEASPYERQILIGTATPSWQST